jgi:hypothetical protein
VFSLTARMKISDSNSQILLVHSVGYVVALELSR